MSTWYLERSLSSLTNIALSSGILCKKDLRSLRLQLNYYLDYLSVVVLKAFTIITSYYTQVWPFYLSSICALNIPVDIGIRTVQVSNANTLGLNFLLNAVKFQCTFGLF